MQLAKIYDRIAALGAQLWAVAPQEKAVNEALRQRRSLPFPILADADLAVIRAWGLFNDRDPKQRLIPYPAAYLLDKQRRVYWRRLSLETRDRPTPADILAALEEIPDHDNA